MVNVLDARGAERVAWSLLILRIVVGVIFMAHGAQKVFGLFGGPGLNAVMGQMGPVLGFLVSVGEFFGGLGILVGFLTRFSAASLIVIMFGAIIMVHGKNGFFLSEKGFEYNFALIGLLFPLLLLGPGPFALPRRIFPRFPALLD
ncbi:MAG: DoxX family protein [Capsulimonadales bacterium]|nr:DoxX family protein [Capsulimonadales bacterium]